MLASTDLTPQPEVMCPVIYDINNEVKVEQFDITDSMNQGNYGVKGSVEKRLAPINGKSMKIVVNKLNCNSSAGPVKIRPQDMKNNIYELCPILTHLLDSIIITGKVPTMMGATYLGPIFKNRNVSSLTCYRPIGLELLFENN